MSACTPGWMKTKRSNYHVGGASPTEASRFMTNETLRSLCSLSLTLRDLASLQIRGSYIEGGIDDEFS